MPRSCWDSPHPPSLASRRLPDLSALSAPGRTASLPGIAWLSPPSCSSRYWSDVDASASAGEAAGRRISRAHERSRAFKAGVALAVANTIIGAGQPALTRWGAVNLDPLLFCTGAVVIAAVCSISLLQMRGELKLLFDRRFRLRLAAIAATILLQTEPVYSLLLAVVVVKERPSGRQLLATATILVGIASVFGAGGTFSPMWAATMVLITPLFWQSSHVMGLRLMPPLSPLTVTA